MLGEETPGEDEEVVELELPRCRPLGGGVEHEATDDRPEEESTMPIDAFERLVGEATQFHFVGTERFQCLAAFLPERRGPLALGPRQRLAFAPLAAFVVEGGECFESRPQTVADESRSEPHEFGNEGGLGVVGGHRGGRDRIGQCGDRVGVETKWPGIGQLDSVAHQIPVRPEVVSDPSGPLVDTESVEFAEFDERPTTGDQPVGGVGLVEQTVEQVTPLFLECETTLEFIEHCETGRQAGFDREVEQDASGERVERADRCVVEPCERCVGGRARVGFESLPSATAQLGGGLFGEGDRGDAGDRYSRANEVDDAGHE